MKKSCVVVLIEDAGYKLGRAGDFYHFINRYYYDTPQFGDMGGAKKMSPQGAATVLRVLRKDGYKVDIKELS